MKKSLELKDESVVLENTENKKAVSTDWYWDVTSVGAGVKTDLPCRRGSHLMLKTKADFGQEGVMV